MQRSLILLAGGFLQVALAADLSLTTDHADGTYARGETVGWSITGGENGASIRYQVLAEGATAISQGQVTFANGRATVRASLDRPGTLLLRLTGVDKTSLLGGAAVAWREIDAVVPEPEDFSRFWQAKIAELQAIPPAPRLEPLPSGDPKVSLWKITLANIKGTHVYGYLARPVGNAPCPALVQFQYAGVYALNPGWVTGPAKRGWLALNIMAHDLPPDRTPAFYTAQSDGPLKDYARQGGSDRETSTFLRMYLGCVRAATYLRDRPDWNRKTLLVHGTSQGGLQAIVTAGLVPEVTMVTALVPAGCDQRGPEQGRAMGFPYWLGQSTGPERAARAHAAGMYDLIHFASRIRCPVLIGMGLIDTTCPASGVFTCFNRLRGPKRLVLMPQSGHKGPHEAYLPVAEAWQTAALRQTPPPLE
jgi:cephalosporin-C deacetylase-like acetyl esterase